MAAGMHSHTQAKTIGAARAARNHANSHGMRISHARRSRAVLQIQQRTWHCNASMDMNMPWNMHGGGGGEVCDSGNIHMQN